MARGGKFWLGMIIGAAAGTVTALLYAPKRGEEMRHDISARTKEAGRKAGEAWGSMKERSSEMVGKGQEIAQTAGARVSEAVRAGHQAAKERCKELKAKLGEESKSAESPPGT